MTESHESYVEGQFNNAEDAPLAAEVSMDIWDVRASKVGPRVSEKVLSEKIRRNSRLVAVELLRR